jgi:DNA-binding transcriptional MerR regulator
MQAKLSIGDFSRMTYLTVKALRHYHDVGVLEPSEVDPSSSYRYYTPSQVAVAQTVRRLRDLGLPLDEIRVIVKEPDRATRDRVLVEHLQRMESQLAQTQETVASLRALIQQRQQTPDVQRRRIAATTAIAIEAVVRADDAFEVWFESFTSLHRWLTANAVARTGPDGALFAAEFFEDGIGAMTVFVPVATATAKRDLPPGMQLVEIAADDVAMLVHDGPFGELDLTYGALGTWVLQRSVGGAGPIREYYLPTDDSGDLLAHTTEVCWPMPGD